MTNTTDIWLPAVEGGRGNMDIFAERLAEAEGPLGQYRQRLARGSLRTDPSQALAAERLQDLWVKLRGYDPPTLGSKRLFPRLARRKAADWAPEARPNGLYMVGDVGRGKSMLMDLFFASADIVRKRRLHFHAFMQEAHSRIHAWRVDHAEGSDPIPALADTIAGGAALLCFDEFQINDIADAIILGRLFEALFARSVIVVATSNTCPDELFAGRPGRDAFLPFIALLKQHLDLLVLDGPHDWRLVNPRSGELWIVPADRRADRRLDEAFERLSASVPAHPARLVVAGRFLSVEQAANGVARFDFEVLCGTALGPGDYLALATHFRALVLDRIPLLHSDNYDAARRFITLIDSLYEHRVKLVASAAAQPDSLYRMTEGAAPFERTASRLQEMQTANYLALAHLT